MRWLVPHVARPIRIALSLLTSPGSQASYHTTNIFHLSRLSLSFLLSTTYISGKLLLQGWLCSRGEMTVTVSLSKFVMAVAMSGVFRPKTLNSCHDLLWTKQCSISVHIPHSQAKETVDTLSPIRPNSPSWRQLAALGTSALSLINNCDRCVNSGYKSFVLVLVLVLVLHAHPLLEVPGLPHHSSHQIEYSKNISVSISTSTQQLVQQI